MRVALVLHTHKPYIGGCGDVGVQKATALGIRVDSRGCVATLEAFLASAREQRVSTGSLCTSEGMIGVLAHYTELTVDERPRISLGVFPPVQDVTEPLTTTPAHQVDARAQLIDEGHLKRL